MPFLTYEPFYGLKEKPFSLASDPAFFYKSGAHVAAFDALSAGIRRREGLIVLSGEIGTGKTTLCRAVLSQLDHKTFSTFVPDPFVTREDLLKTMLVGFGILSVSDINAGRLHGASRQDLSYPLYEFLDSLVPLQAYAVLVIDEAQNLSLGVMEEIRILAELEKRDKLLQVVLVGQPELRDNLRLPQMRQVEQRVTVRCELAPLLAFVDVVEYVTHRLSVAGADSGGGVEFTGGALEDVHLASGGVPRVINLICDRALQRGFEAQRRTIDRDMIAAAVKDLALGPHPVDGDLSTSSFVLPLPFDPPAGQPLREAPSGTQAFPPESSTPQRRPQVTNALAEFDSEPEIPPPAPPVARTVNSEMSPPATRGLLAMIARALGVAAATIGIAVGAGVLDTRGAWAVVVPDALPLLPPPSVRAVIAATAALPVVDALSAALTDGRAHEPDDYSVVVADFQDRGAAERLTNELSAQGYRARWLETGADADAAQQVYVDGYGTFDDALSTVTRLRRQPAAANARLFRVPGAIRRQP